MTSAMRGSADCAAAGLANAPRLSAIAPKIAERWRNIWSPFCEQMTRTPASQLSLQTIHRVERFHGEMLHECSCCKASCRGTRPRRNLLMPATDIEEIVRQRNPRRPHEIDGNQAGNIRD